RPLRPGVVVVPDPQVEDQGQGAEQDHEHERHHDQRLPPLRRAGQPASHGTARALKTVYWLAVALGNPTLLTGWYLQTTRTPIEASLGRVWLRLDRGNVCLDRALPSPLNSSARSVAGA